MKWNHPLPSYKYPGIFPFAMLISRTYPFPIPPFSLSYPPKIGYNRLISSLAAPVPLYLERVALKR